MDSSRWTRKCIERINKTHVISCLLADTLQCSLINIDLIPNLIPRNNQVYPNFQQARFLYNMKKLETITFRKLPRLDCYTIEIFKDSVIFKQTLTRKSANPTFQIHAFPFSEFTVSLKSNDHQELAFAIDMSCLEYIGAILDIEFEQPTLLIGNSNGYYIPRNNDFSNQIVQPQPVFGF